MELINDYSTVGLCIKRNILLTYLLNVRVKINVHKERAMSMQKLRNDCQMVKISQFKDDEHYKEIILESFIHVDENYMNELKNNEEV